MIRVNLGVNQCSGMIRHKLISVKNALLSLFRPRQSRWVGVSRAFVLAAGVVLALSVVVSVRSTVLREAFVRQYATDLLASVDPDAVIVVGDTTGTGSSVEIAMLTDLQQREGMRPDVRIVMTDVTADEDDLTAATAAIFREPENAGRPVYLTYAIDHLNPDWRTAATGYLYLLVQEGVELPNAPSTGTIAFPDAIPEGENAYRGLVSLASYRYAAFLQETVGKEAALPHLLRAIDYDEREGSVTYQAYTARRQTLIDRGGKR